MDQDLIESLIATVKSLGPRQAQKHLAAAMREIARELRGSGCSQEADQHVLAARAAQQAVLSMMEAGVTK